MKRLGNKLQSRVQSPWGGYTTPTDNVMKLGLGLAWPPSTHPNSRSNFVIHDRTRIPKPRGLRSPDHVSISSFGQVIGGTLIGIKMQCSIRQQGTTVTLRMLVDDLDNDHLMKFLHNIQAN